MFCPKCGKEIKVGAAFCTNCGSAISVTPEHSEIQKSESVASKKNSKSMHIIAIIVVLLLLITIVKKATAKPPIELHSISFNDSLFNGDFETIEFTNTSNKVIAYVTFTNYYYDRMGGFLDYYEHTYTGPLEPDETVTAKWGFGGYYNQTCVMWPKEITVEFENGKKVKFKNDFYAAGSDFYGGKLKDK